MQDERSHRILGRSSETTEMFSRVATASSDGNSRGPKTRFRGPAAPRLGREQVSGPGPCFGLGIVSAIGGRQLPLVLVTATAVGVAAFTVATVVAVVEAVVLAVVAAVAVATVAVAGAAAVAVAVVAAPEAFAVDWPFAAPTVMNPVRTAATATPPTPAARRARRAGCGRRRRLDRTAAGAGIWGISGIWFSFSVFIEVFLSARSLGLSR